MNCERCRIKEAQDRLYNWCLNNLPVGRDVIKEDVISIENVHVHNISARKKLFGSGSFVWYLKGPSRVVLT